MENSNLKTMSPLYVIVTDEGLHRGECNHVIETDESSDCSRILQSSLDLGAAEAIYRRQKSMDDSHRVRLYCFEAPIFMTISASQQSRYINHLDSIGWYDKIKPIKSS